MLAQILPGLRELRGPLAAGFLWLLLGWLIFHGAVAGAHGKVKEIADLGAKVGSPALTAAAAFVAYLIGSFSEDLFGRLLLDPAIRGMTSPKYERPYGMPSEDMSEVVRDAQIARLEEETSRLRAESDLRVAILPPAIAIVIYFGVTDSPWWFLGLFLAPTLGAQAWVRRRDYVLAASALWDLRRAAGIRPSSAREADAVEDRN